MEHAWAEEKEGRGQGRRAVRGVSQKRIEVIGKFGDGVEDGLASPVMEGVGADPNGWSRLETSGPGFKLVRSQQDHTLRGPFLGPVWDLSTSLRGLLPERVWYPPRGGDLGIYFEFPPVDLVARFLERRRGVKHGMVNHGGWHGDGQVVQV